MIFGTAGFFNRAAVSAVVDLERGVETDLRKGSLEDRFTGANGGDECKRFLLVAAAVFAINVLSFIFFEDSISFNDVGLLLWFVCNCSISVGILSVVVLSENEVERMGV
jgi:hypothetical protein